MYRVDEREEQRRRFGLAGFVLFAALALAFVAPALASAELVPLEVEKDGAGEGTVTSSPAGISCGGDCEQEYAEGTEVTLTASADSESEFIEWEGCDSQPEGKCKVTMSGWRIVTAVFEEIELPEYSLEIDEGGNGGEGEWECLVGGEEEFCEDRYPAGTHVTIKTTPYEGSKFAGFSGDCTGGTCNLVMDKDHSVTVIFNLLEFTLTVKQNGTGFGKFECELEEGPEPCKSKYQWEKNVTLIATAEPGSEFAKWEGCDKTPKPGLCEVEFEEARSVLVTFNKEPSSTYYTLEVKREGKGSGTVTSEPVGIDCGIKCTGEFLEGAKVTLIAVPDKGSEFSRWGAGVSGTCTFNEVCWTTMGADKTVNAIFSTTGEPPEFKLTVSKVGTGSGTVTSSPAGINCGATCFSEFGEGTEVTLTATASAGSEWVSWSGCATQPEPGKCKVTMSAAKTVTATFAETEAEPTPEFKLTVSKVGTGSGTVTSSPAGINCGATCFSEFDEGAAVTLTATASAGSEFAGWSGSGCSGTSTCKVTMSSAKTVTATFNLKPSVVNYTLEIKMEGTGTGTVTSDPAGIECGGDCTEDYAEGTAVTLTATPAAGSEFKRWSGVEGGCALEQICRTKMGASKVVKAIFSSTEPTPVPGTRGEVKIVRRVVLVRRGKALLVLRCAGGACRGGLEMVAKVRKRKKKLIGTRSFSLAAGGRKTIKVRLSRAAMREIARRGKLKAMVRGGGVVDSPVKLKRARKKR